MKKLIKSFALGVLFLSPFSVCNAAKIAVTVYDGTLQAGTTAGFHTSSGTAVDFSAQNLKSTGTWTLSRATFTHTNTMTDGTLLDKSTVTFVGGVFNGTRTDNSTTTWTAAQTISSASISDLTSATIHGSSGTINSFTAQSGTMTIVAIGSGTFSNFIGGKGTTTNDNAPAGWIGEYVSSATTVLTSYGATNTYVDIATLTLTAGDWDISANCRTSQNGATWTQVICGVSTTGGNSGAGLVVGDNAITNTWASSATTPESVSAAIPGVRASINSTTVYYLKTRSLYSVGTPQYVGRISARRVR